MSEKTGRKTQNDGMDIFRNEAVSEGQSKKYRKRSNYFAKNWA